MNTPFHNNSTLNKYSPHFRQPDISRKSRKGRIMSNLYDLARALVPLSLCSLPLLSLLSLFLFFVSLLLLPSSLKGSSISYPGPFFHIHGCKSSSRSFAQFHFDPCIMLLC